MVRKLLLLLWLCLPLVAQDAIAITGAVVIDGTGAPPSRATVLVRGGRIAAVGADVAVPPEARVIRADGQTLLPGLFDLHTHLMASPIEGVAADWGKILKSYLYAGVTSVSDVGAFGEQLEPMRRLIAEGLPAPKIRMAVRFSSPGGHGAEGGRGDFYTQQVQTPREAQAAVRRILVYKPDLLKIFSDGWRYGMAKDMTSMDQETLTALVAEGHKNGIPCVSHTVTLERAKMAARAGMDAIIHGIGDAPVDDELIRLFREHRTSYALTLAVFEAHVFPDGAPPLLAELLTPAAVKNLSRSARPSAARTKRWKNLTYSVTALRDAGLPISCGTDAGMASTFHGYATHREIQLLVSAGLSPLEAITAATGNSARAVGVDGDRGTIAVGRAADLLLVEGSPHENIADLMRISHVFLNGKEIDRAALREAIHAPGPTPMKAREIPALLDDFESADGRSRIDTLWVNATDAGHDHTRMSYQRTLRKPGDHALTVLAEMSEKNSPYASMVLPLSKGAVEPADISRYSAVEFDARGDGRYALLLLRRGVGRRAAAPLEFQAAPEWRKVHLRFAERYRDALALQFRLQREASQKVWLELDNIRLVE
jgi:imidazolonepropionase-like amidohydrolase